MDWAAIGGRVRKQRESMGFTREKFAEMLDITPKFCADIELGKKGMSIPTLCHISELLKLSTDYILYGKTARTDLMELGPMLETCSPEEFKAIQQIAQIVMGMSK